MTTPLIQTADAAPSDPLNPDAWVLDYEHYWDGDGFRTNDYFAVCSPLRFDFNCSRFATFSDAGFRKLAQMRFVPCWLTKQLSNWHYDAEIDRHHDLFWSRSFRAKRHQIESAFTAFVGHGDQRQLHAAYRSILARVEAAA